MVSTYKIYTHICDLYHGEQVVPNVAAGDVDSLASFGCGSALLFTQASKLMAVPLTAPFTEESAAVFTVATGVRAFEVTTEGLFLSLSLSLFSL